MIRQLIFRTLGHVFVALALFGFVAPFVSFIPLYIAAVWPSVPLLVAALWCYARGSKKLYDKLLANKTFGPVLKDWSERGVISFRAKMLSFVTISLSAAYAFYKLPEETGIIYVSVCALILIFVLTRPSK